PDVASVTSGSTSRAAMGPRRAVRAWLRGSGRGEGSQSGGRKPERRGVGRGGACALPAPLVFATLSNQGEGGRGFWGCYSLVDVIRAAGKVRRRTARAAMSHTRAPSLPAGGPGPLPSVVLSLSGMQAGPLKRGPAHCCRRRLFEPRPRGAPRPADAPDPGPTFAVAA